MKVVGHLISILLLLIAPHAFGQYDTDEQVPVNPNPISKSTYERIAAEIDYTKTKKALRKRSAAKQIEQEEEIIISGTVDTDSVQHEKIERQRSIYLRSVEIPGLGIIQILAYILIALLIGFLIYFIFSRIDIDREFEPDEIYEVEDDFEDINDIDTPSLLQQALAKGDYRTAVRIQFLSILQTLSQKEKIIWRKEKTNHEYARELRAEKYGYNFQQMANIFDFVWYGKREVDKAQYDLIEQEFKQFKTQMNEA